MVTFIMLGLVRDATVLGNGLCDPLCCFVRSVVPYGLISWGT